MLIESGLPGTRGLFSDESPVLIHALSQMDEWLSRLNAGNGTRPSLAAIAKAKPADLTDACFTDNGTIRIAETQIYQGDTKCNKLYPSYSSPRMVAGEPLANNVLKCQLRPIDATDYGGKLGKDDLKALALRQRPDVRASHVPLTDAEIRERMSGNLCRCGAYVNIVAAIREAAQ